MDDFVKTHTHRNDPSTSTQAAKTVSTVKTHKAKLLQAFQLAPMTADQACLIAGIPAYPGRQRVTDLLQEGSLVDTGKVAPGDSGRNMRVLRVA